MTSSVSPPRGRTLLVTVAALCVLASTGVSNASAATRRVRIGSAPILPAGVTPLAGSASIKTMRVTVALKPRSAGAMNAYARTVSNPVSTNYHRYLTTAAFRRRFAPTARAVARVQAALRANGLPSGRLTANGLALEFTTDSARVEKGFSLTLARVRTASGQDVVYNVEAPAVNASVASSVQSVLGLDGFSHPRADPVTHTSARASSLQVASASSRSATARVATGGPQACTAAANAPTTSPTTASGAWTADQIATAYSFSGLYHSGDRGAGATVGLYELEPNLASDIAAYQRCYGTSTSVSYVKVDGGAFADPNAGGPAGEGEAALDIEQVIGLAPKAKILVYQGPNSDFSGPGAGPYDVYAAMISQNRASVISTSWGQCETDVGAAAAQAEDQLFEEATIQGQTVVAAAGDSGSEDCYYPSGGEYNSSLAVDDPASQPFVTGAGGTTLAAIGPAPTESIWNDGASGGGGGGGLSLIWSMPSYQSTASSGLQVIRSGQSNLEGCGPTSSQPSYPYCREVPDVAADADEDTGYLVYYNGTRVNAGPAGWQGIGGTSAAAPLWAALFALADANSTCRNTRVGFANGRLYTLASESQSTYFNDITTGNNDVLGSQGGDFAAAAGYDMASGLGTPIASRLAPSLCSAGITVANPGARHTLARTAVRLQLHARLGSGVAGPIHYSARNLPAGLALNATTGVIHGTPVAASARTVTVDAYNNAGVYGATTFRWTIAGRPKISAVSLAKAAQGRPELRLTVAAGAHEAALRLIRIRLPAGVSSLVGHRGAIHAVVGGKDVKRNVSVDGRTVTIRFATPRLRFEVDFVPGSLQATGAVRADAARRAPRPVPLEVTVTDADGATTALQLAVRPRD